MTAFLAPALTDHAFATPQGRLVAALHPYRTRPTVSPTGEAPGTTHPLVAHLGPEALSGLDHDGRAHRIAPGARLLVCAARPASGRVTVLVSAPNAVRRLDVYADVLAAAYQADGTTLLDALAQRLARLRAA